MQIFNMNIMYKILVVMCMCFVVPCRAQSKLPGVTIKTFSGKEVPFDTITANGDTATVVSFWATWCIPCVTELDIISDKLSSWEKDIPFKFIIISVDDARTSAKVRSFVAGRGWNFISYLDPNNDLKRALSINEIPSMLVIKKGSIVYQHNGYVPGNEDELLTKLKSL